MVQSYEHLLRYFGHIPGYEAVLPRVHDFTEGFRDAWLATEVSKDLRENPTEQDLWFVPSNGGFEPELSYRWE